MDREKDGEQQPMTVRFPLGVLNALRRLAKRHQRSFNGEVIWAIREYLEKHGERVE